MYKCPFGYLEIICLPILYIRYFHIKMLSLALKKSEMPRMQRDMFAAQ